MFPCTIDFVVFHLRSNIGLCGLGGDAHQIYLQVTIDNITVIYYVFFPKVFFPHVETFADVYVAFVLMFPIFF